MEKRQLGKTGIYASAICQGSWQMAGNVWGDVDDAVSIATIHKAVESGITLLDTAASYGGGRSEEVVGKGLKGIRDKVVLCTKCGLRVLPDKSVEYNLKPDSIRREVEQSLRRLDTDHIDLYQFHYPDPDTPVGESLKAMYALKEEGLIRAIGVSNFTLQQVEQALQSAPLDSVQLKFNLLNREDAALIEYCRDNGVSVITYGSIAGGMLSGAYKQPPVFGKNDRRKDFYPFFSEPLFSKARKLVDVLEEIAREKGRATVDIAINWVINQPGVTFALVGAITPEEAAANAKAGDFMLTPGELARIDDTYSTLFGK